MTPPSESELPTCGDRVHRIGDGQQGPPVILLSTDDTSPPSSRVAMGPGPIMEPVDDGDHQAVPPVINVTITSAAHLYRRMLDGIFKARLEVFFVLYLSARFMIVTPIQELLIKKACLYTLKLNASVCSHLDDYEDIKSDAEQISSAMSTMQMVVAMAPSAIISIFIGPWCDKYGYRTPVVFATLGFLATTVLNLVTVRHMQLPLYANVLASIPDGCSGGLISVFTAVHSQAIVTTGSKRRRGRFFALNMTITLSAPLGGFTGGLIYGRFGWNSVLGVSFLVGTLGLLWACFALGNVVKPENLTDGLALRVRNLFRLDNMYAGLKSTMKRRPNKGRAQLWCLVAATCCVVIDHATMSITYFYVHHMYSWTVARYTVVQTASALVGAAMNLPIIYLFLRVFKVSDPFMALVGVCFIVAEMLILGIAYKEWLYYIYCLAGVPTFLARVGIRTHYSMLLDDDEVGKVFAFLSSFDSLVPIAGDVVLTWLFNVSLEFLPGLPGLPFLVAALIACIATGLIAYVTKVHKEIISYEGMSNVESASKPGSGKSAQDQQDTSNSSWCV
ncbi:putative peptidoglycan muropeptide transporter SLC46 [Amblyomma americanum]